MILQLTYTSERRLARNGSVLREELPRFKHLLTVLLAGLRRVVGKVTSVAGKGPPPRSVELILEVER